MLLPILQSNFIHDKEFLELWSLSCFSEPVVLQVGNNNSGNFMWPPLALFWESVLVQLFKTCGWKACVLKPPPLRSYLGEDQVDVNEVWQWKAGCLTDKPVFTLTQRAVCLGLKKKAGGGREELVQWVNFMNNCIPWFLRTNRWELWDWNCLHAKKGLNSCTVSFGFKWKIMLQKEFCIKERSKTVVK